MRVKSQSKSNMSQLTTADKGDQPDILSSYLGNLGLPAFIVTTLFPNLFGKVSKYPRAARLLTIPLVLWLASNFLIGKLYSLWRKVMSNAMASVTITSDDFYLYAAFKSWLSKQKLWMLERAITAQSIFYLRNKGQDGRTIEKELANNKSIVFDPQNKFQLFRYQGRFFLLTMDTKQMLHTSTDRTEMKIWCLGLSPQPIENMLLDIYDASRTGESRTMTTIMTPYSGRQWNRRCIKPARPLSSVYMEPDQKDRLMADMTEYLAPETAKWYQDRGIPYRRGYLFHGVSLPLSSLKPDLLRVLSRANSSDLGTRMRQDIPRSRSSRPLPSRRLHSLPPRSRSFRLSPPTALPSSTQRRSRPPRRCRQCRSRSRSSC